MLEITQNTPTKEQPVEQPKDFSKTKMPSLKNNKMSEDFSVLNEKIPDFGLAKGYWAMLHVPDAEKVVATVEVDNKKCLAVKVLTDSAPTAERMTQQVVTLPNQDDLSKEVTFSKVSKQFASTPGAVDELVRFSSCKDLNPQDFSAKNMLYLPLADLQNSLQTLEQKGIGISAHVIAALSQIQEQHSVSFQKTSEAPSVFVTKQLATLPTNQNHNESHQVIHTKFLECKEFNGNLYANRTPKTKDGKIIPQDVVIVPTVIYDRSREGYYVVMNLEDRLPLSNGVAGREHWRNLAFPAGLVDLEDGNTPKDSHLTAGQRELNEETGQNAGQVTQLINRLYSSPECTSEPFAVVLATGETDAIKLTPASNIDNLGVIHIPPENSDGGVTVENLYIPLDKFDDFLSSQPEHVFLNAQTLAAIQLALPQINEFN